MKRVLLLAFCIALSACSTFGPVPRSSMGYHAAPVLGFYGGGYSSYSSSAKIRGSAITPYGRYDPYHIGSARTTGFRYTPHYYRSHGIGHSSSITLGLGYDPFHRSSLFGRHRNSLGYGSGYGGHGLGHGVGHGRRH